MSTYYLVSAGGTPNLGDDLIAIGWIARLKQFDPRCTIYLDCPQPGNFTLALQKTGYSCAATVTNLFWRIVQHYMQDPQCDFANLRRDLATNTDTDIELLYQIAGEAGSIHFLGGGYMNSIWPRHFLAMEIAKHLKDRFNTAVYWTGASIYPSDSVQLLNLSEALSAFDFISTRDEPSRALLTGFAPNVRASVDDLFLWLARLLPRKATRRRSLLVNVQSDLFEPAEFARTLDDIQPCLAEAARAGLTVRYLEAFPNIDRVAYDFFRQSCPQIQWIGYFDLLRSLVQGDFDPGFRSIALVSRFHLHLYFAWSGIAGFYIPREGDYYANKHASLIERGSTFQRYSSSALREQLTVHCDCLPPSNLASFVAKKESELNELYGVNKQW